MDDMYQDTVQWMACLKRVLWHSRDWHRREQSQAHMHGAIFKACELAQPLDWQQMVMEWPHASEDGIAKIAYTRDEANGIADRQVVTTVGKYLARHFPTLRDNIIRDIAARYVMGTFKFVHTMREMLDVIERGPSSCMGSKTADYFRCEGHHPYQAYDPEHGWHMAVYVESDGRYTGRALCNGKTFVRTYRASDSTYSGEDDRMRVWLEEQGYTKEYGWDGFCLKRIPVSNDCGFVAPYLDGSHQHVIIDGNKLVIVDGDDDGEFECTNQNGDASEVSSRTCEECGDRVPEDDGYWVGRGEDALVCQHCCDHHYVYAYGRNGNRYYVNQGDAIHCNDEWYEVNYISDNNIVCLEDGEYCEMDDAIYIESESEYYDSDDSRICYTVDGENELISNCVELENGEYCLETSAWQCEHSGDWYANSDCDPVTTACGKSIHEDYEDEYPTQAELFVEPTTKKEGE